MLIFWYNEVQIVHVYIYIYISQECQLTLFVQEAIEISYIQLLWFIFPDTKFLYIPNSVFEAGIQLPPILLQTSRNFLQYSSISNWLWIQSTPFINFKILSGVHLPLIPSDMIRAWNISIVKFGNDVSTSLCNPAWLSFNLETIKFLNLVISNWAKSVQMIYNIINNIKWDHSILIIQC